MVAVRYTAVLAVILVLQSYFGTSNSVPLFGVGNVCQESNLCGKGNCAASNNSAFGYKCVCDSGWKQSGAEDDKSLEFLPCVIPNCSLNNNCVNAPAAAPNNNKPTSSSILDPCFWTDCGGGKCVKTSLFRSACLCEDGYYNLFNATVFPCYKQCAFGMDCTSLGINLGNASSSSTATPSNSYGVSLIRRAGFVSSNSMIMTILAMVVCHYI